MPDRALFALYRLLRRIRSGANVRTVDTAEGRLWPVYHTAPAPYQADLGVPVVLFHGFGNDATTWLPFLPTLAVAREVAAPDLPGFGYHRLRGDEEPTPRWYRSVAASLLRELTVRWGQPPIVVGKSMGGMIAGLVAGELPQLVRKLVLIDPAGIETPQKSDFWTAYESGRNLLMPETPAEWEAMVEVLYHTPPRVPSFVRNHVLRTVSERRTTYTRIFESLLAEGYNPLGERLHRIQCPVTVVWGASDRVMDPSGVDVIRAALPDAKIHLLPDCGHSPTTEKPEELTRILVRVLSRWG